MELKVGQRIKSANPAQKILVFQDPNGRLYAGIFEGVQGVAVAASGEIGYEIATDKVRLKDKTCFGDELVIINEVDEDGLHYATIDTVNRVAPRERQEHYRPRMAPIALPGDSASFSRVELALIGKRKKQQARKLQEHY